MTRGASDRGGAPYDPGRGRQAGCVVGYRYSKGLKESGILWTEQTLDRWLINPWTFVRGNRMRLPGLGDTQDRTADIELLKAAAREVEAFPEGSRAALEQRNE